MASRRKFLSAVGTISGVTILAGCSSGDSTADQDNQEETADQQGDQQETESDGSLPDLRVSDITLSYSFSAGLTSNVKIFNTLESGSGTKTVNVSMQAYSGDQLLGEDNAWQDIQSELPKTYELAIESISETADNSIDDVTEFLIQVKLSEGEYSTILSLSGDELRERVDS